MLWIRQVPYDPVNPYIMRGKNQFTGEDPEYENNLGTTFDRRLVVNYAPLDKLEFSRIEFYIENTSTVGTQKSSQIQTQLYGVRR